jgi:prepilin-type N-terminal cleavage/methylation domain-containing protein
MRTGTAPRAGFTTVELIIVLMIGAVLVAITAPALGEVGSRRAVLQASDGLVLLSARARAVAANRGEIVRLEIDPAATRARVITTAGDTASMVDFGVEHGVGMSTGIGGMIVLCYTSRGFALPSCTNLTGTTNVTFTRGAQHANVLVRPLGQVRRN